MAYTTYICLSQLWSGKSKIKALLDLVVGEDPPSGLKMTIFWLCSHMAFPWCLHKERACSGLMTFLEGH